MLFFSSKPVSYLFTSVGRLLFKSLQFSILVLQKQISYVESFEQRTSCKTNIHSHRLIHFLKSVFVNKTSTAVKTSFSGVLPRNNKKRKCFLVPCPGAGTGTYRAFLIVVRSTSPVFIETEAGVVLVFVLILKLTYLCCLGINETTLLQYSCYSNSVVISSDRAVARKNLWLRQCPWKTYDRGNLSMVEFCS